MRAFLISHESWFMIARYTQAMAAKPITLHRISAALHIKAQLTRKADPNERDKWGRTPLHTLAAADELDEDGENQSVVCTQLLIEAGADVNAKDDLGRTPIYYLANIPELVKAGAKVDAKDKQGQTPLHAAITGKRALELLAAGADLDSTDKQGKTPLETVNPHVAEVLRAAQAQRSIEQAMTQGQASTGEPARKKAKLSL